MRLLSFLHTRKNEYYSRIDFVRLLLFGPLLEETNTLALALPVTCAARPLDYLLAVHTLEQSLILLLVKSEFIIPFRNQASHKFLRKVTISFKTFM